MLFGGCTCGSKKRQQRTSDAAAVEPINAPPLDAGGRTAGGDEVEPNDGDDVAMRLTLAATVHGKIEPETDVDEFRIDIAKAGVLAIEVAVLDGDAALELEDPSGAVIARSDRGAAKVKEGVPNVSVAPGKYMAIVKGRKPPPPKRGKKPPPQPLLAVYDITAQLVTPSAGAEHEPDDDRGTANELIVGDTAASGFVGWANDADVWKVSVETLSAKNELEVELSAVEGIALTLELLESGGQVLATRRGPKGAAVAMRDIIPTLPAGAPPFYYLTVRADKSNPETPYQLHAFARPVETDAEEEPNDGPDKAYAVPGERTVVNARWSAGDIDCFAVAPEPDARTLDVQIDVPQEADLRAELFVDGKSLGKIDHPGKGVDEKLSGPVAGNSKAVVCVRGTEIAGEARYAVHFHDGPAAATP